MAANIYDLSTTAGSNTTIDGVDVSGATGKVKDGDNVMRSLGAYLAQVLDDLGAVNTPAGTNTITVTAASGYTAYATGQILRIRPANSITGAATLNVNGIGAKSIRKINDIGTDSALVSGDMLKARVYTVIYDATANGAAGAWIVTNPEPAPGVAPYPTGHLYGLTLSNNGSDATNDIDIAVGTARDGADSANMDLASALTKRLDASWAVGTNQGGLDGTESVAGTPDTSTWYHVWLIKRPDTGVVDVLFSESATSPTMPTNYTLKRRLGAVYNNSSGDIASFTQLGDEFLLGASVTDVAANAPGTSAVTRTLTVPTGLKVHAKIIASLINNSGSTVAYAHISELDRPDEAATIARSFTGAAAAAAANSSYGNNHMMVRTNTSAQVRSIVSNLGDANVTLSIVTLGWVDTRGRFY